MELFENRSALVAMILATTLTVGIGSTFKNRNEIVTMFQKEEVEPVLELTTDIVTLNTGDTFIAESYIKTATDSKGENAEKDVASASIATSKECEFEVVYTLVDETKTIEKKLEVKVMNEE